MGMLDPEYTGKVVDSSAQFEEEIAKKRRQQEQEDSSKKMKLEASKKKLSESFETKGQENARKLGFTSNKEKPASSSNETVKGLAQGVNTSLSNDGGEKPPSPFGDALLTGISSGGNPAAIGGAFMMGLIKSVQYKKQQKEMGKARAEMEKAKGEQQKAQIALRMGDSVSRAIGGAGRKRSINI